MSRQAPIRIALFLILLAAGLFPLGCSDESSPRSVVTIETINNSQVVDSDVLNYGDDQLPGTSDDYIVEDQVSVVLRNRPHDTGLNIRANGPFSAVVFNRYEIRFTGDETLSPLYGGIHIRVPSGGTASGILTIVPAGYKQVPPLFMLREGGEMRFTAHVVLIGVEEDSQDEVRAEATIPVHCANWTDP